MTLGRPAKRKNQKAATSESTPSFSSEWVEPEPMVQLPGTTGYPLGMPPPAKLLPKPRKKFEKVPFLSNNSSRRFPLTRETRSQSIESDDTTPRSADESEGKHTTRRTSSKSQSPALNGEALSPSAELHQNTINAIQDELNKNLKTTISDKLVKPCHMRSSLKRLHIDLEEYDPDMYERLTNRIGSERLGIKQYEKPSPTVSRNRKRFRQTTAQDSNSIGSRNRRQKRMNGYQHDSGNASGTDMAMDNDDFCFTCGGLGRFLCCESCPKSFHFSCVDPPLDEESLPEGEWFCKECRAKRSPPPPHKGMFRGLLANLDKRNPVVYKLPTSIKNRFVGVYANESGEYRDLDVKVYKSTRSGFLEDQDLLKLTDKQGNPIFCYKCKGSTMGSIPMARCDYCSLSWHLDCLDPPLPTAKTVGTKWKCPNHADKVYKKARRPKHAQVVDTSLRRGYQNDGNVDVIDSSDEEKLDVFSKDIPDFNITHRKGSPVIKVVAPPQPSLFQESQPHDTNEVALHLPSDGVKLDFIRPNSQVDSQNAQESQVLNNTEILVSLDHLGILNKDVRETVRNLSFLKYENTTDYKVASCRSNIELLLETALTFNPPEEPKTLLEALKLDGPEEPYTPAHQPLIKSTTRGGKRGGGGPYKHIITLRTNKAASAAKAAATAAHTETKPRKAVLEKAMPDDFGDKALHDAATSLTDEERNNLIKIRELMQAKNKDELVRFLVDGAQ